MAAKKHFRKRSSHEKTQGAHPFWSGTITFGLVSVPVNLFPAQRNIHTGLRMLAPDGTPLSRQYYCPQHERNIPPEQIVRGYEVAKGEYVVVSDEELESLQPRKSHDIDLQRFVKRDELPPLFFERAYFLTPAGDSTKAYRLLAEVMQREDRAGIATFVMRGKEYLVAILAENGILRAETLRFEEEVRKPADIGLPEATRADASLRKSLETSINNLKSKELPLELMSDQYHTRLQAMVDRKRKSSSNLVRVEPDKKSGDHKTIDHAPDGKPVDLLESIRRQLSGSNGSAASAPAAPKRSASHRTKLDELSKDGLYEQARRLNISGRSKMTKKQLISAIEKQ